MKERLAALGLFLLVFGVYLKGAAPSVTAGDSGEFMTAAATLSLAHAPSFPLYSVLGKAFLTLIPIGSIPFRLNVFSAFTSSLALAVLFFVARTIGVGLVASFCISLLAGVSTSYWHNSLITEVFSLNALWMTLLLWCLAKAASVERDQAFRFLFLFSLLLGIGLGNHHILIFMGAGLAVYGFLHRESFLNDFPRRIVLCLLFGVLGFLIYLVLPIRSAKEPPLNWGQPVTPHKLVRTIARKDYGSLKLAIGESPERSISNMGRHLTQFSKQLTREVPWPVLLLMAAGFVFGFKQNPFFFLSAIAVFLLSGPFFILLGNLPFNAQSEGIMGRFYIMPVLALVLGLFGFARRFQRASQALLPAVALVLFARGAGEAFSTRHQFLVWDYGQAMLRTLPRGAILFMDGGDDAFYSLALLHEALGKRPDVDLHDRGGLVFKNIYGDDFRRLAPAEKMARRHQIERGELKRRAVFYSTMDPKVLPGASLRDAGFLIEATENSNPSSPARISWPVLCLRSLYPPVSSDYRTRALAAFFPYMRARQLFNQGEDWKKGLAFLARAEVIGHDVDWFRPNAETEYAFKGYNLLMAGRWESAEAVYRQWIRFNPANTQAACNLGVVYERMGRVDEARRQYKETAERFPHLADPVFNLAVMEWKVENWPLVVSLLEEVLRRKPDHPDAQRYLAQARLRDQSRQNAMKER